MIIDSHAHVFQHWTGACGHESRHVHKSYLRKIGTGPAAKIFRVRDGKQVPSSGLLKQGDYSWAGFVENVNFYPGQFGQLTFTIEGEDYYIQYMPVAMKDLEAPPELMLAHMTNAGVDHCVLQAGGAYGAMNDYNAFAQNQYPARFTGLMNVDEGAADSPAALAEIDRAYHKLGLKGLYYKADFSRQGYQRNFNDRDFDAFWERIRSFGIPVFVELTATPNFDKPSYLAQLMRLADLVTRYADVRWLLVMAPPVKHFAKDGRYDFPPEVLAALKRDNLLLEVTYPITYGGVWDYPYPEAQALIRDLRDKLGADRLVWGSDMPNVERFCTYPQSLDYIRRYCPFLSASEKDQILGGTIAKLLGIGRRGEEELTRGSTA